MPFKKILTELVDSIPGATGAILADWEGEAVEQFCHFDEFEMKVIGAHNGVILARVRALHSGIQIGEIENIVITADTQRYLIAPVGPEYYLVLTLERTALQSHALYRAETAVAMLKKEIC